MLYDHNGGLVQSATPLPAHTVLLCPCPDPASYINLYQEVVWLSYSYSQSFSSFYFSSVPPLLFKKFWTPKYPPHLWVWIVPITYGWAPIACISWLVVSNCILHHFFFNIFSFRVKLSLSQPRSSCPSTFLDSLPDPTGGARRVKRQLWCWAALWVKPSTWHVGGSGSLEMGSRSALFR